MVSGGIGSERVRQALVPTEGERMQRTIDDLQKKLAAALAAQTAGAPAQRAGPARESGRHGDDVFDEGREAAARLRAAVSHRRHLIERGNVMSFFYIVSRKILGEIALGTFGSENPLTSLTGVS